MTDQTSDASRALRRLSANISPASARLVAARWRSARGAVANLMAALGLLGCAASGAGTSDPDALWKIVHGRCVPNQLLHDDPSPCAMVDLSGGAPRGYTVLKDRRGVAQYLLIPTARLTGIEDPTLLAPGTPNYFAAAWQARRFVEAKLGRELPPDGVGLAINSAFGRTQNEFHIHVDCLRLDVRDALRAQQAHIADRWAPLSVPLAGHRWMAMRLPSDGQAPADSPFLLLADGLPGARAEMGSHTLVVVGAPSVKDGQRFVLLDHRANSAAGDPGSGEELLDHACAEPVTDGAGAIKVRSADLAASGDTR